jgi:uncharacterized circularly permuted ATP-grasp superfamily protein
MYVLEIREESKKYKYNKNSNFKSFEDFEFLMREKENIENDYKNKGIEVVCIVYKISNNGKEVTRLTNRSQYKVVTDFDKEYRIGWKQYCSVREKLVENNIRDFYVDNNILYIKNGEDIIEVEMVRKTPRYEVRKNGVVVYDSITSQNEVIDKIFNKNGNKLRKRFVKDEWGMFYKG